MFTVYELALFLNVKESWIRQQIFKRKIPFTKINGLIRFDKNEINLWINSQSRKTI
jgi:excisionase family DNA binding protein